MMFAEKEFATGSDKSTSSSVSSGQSSFGEWVEDVAWFEAPEGSSRVPFSKENMAQGRPALTLRVPSPPNVRGRGSEPTQTQSPSFPRPAFFSPPHPPSASGGANQFGGGGYYTKNALHELQMLRALASPRKDTKTVPLALSAAHALARTLGHGHRPDRGRVAASILPPGRTPCNSPTRSLASPHSADAAKAAHELAQIAHLRAAAAAAVVGPHSGAAGGVTSTAGAPDFSPTPCNSPTRPSRPDIATPTSPAAAPRSSRFGGYSFSAGKK